MRRGINVAGDVARSRAYTMRFVRKDFSRWVEMIQLGTWVRALHRMPMRPSIHVGRRGIVAGWGLAPTAGEKFRSRILIGRP